MHPTKKKRYAVVLWPRFSHTVEHLNYNAALWKWIATHSGHVSVFPHRFELYADIQNRCGGAPISYLEFGVWHGESLKKWAQVNQHPESRFYGFDSFEGLPEPMHHSFGRSTPKAAFSLSGNVPEFGDPRILAVKGLFQSTLRPFLNKTELHHPMVVHNDSDLHSSTIYTLATLDPVLKAGDFVIFDEFSSPACEFRAWMEYLNAFMRDAECLGMSDDWLQVAFRMA